MSLGSSSGERQDRRDGQMAMQEGMNEPIVLYNVLALLVDPLSSPSRRSSFRSASAAIVRQAASPS